MYVTSLPVNYPLKNTSIAPALYMFGESASVMQFAYHMCFPASSCKTRKNEKYCKFPICIIYLPITTLPHYSMPCPHDINVSNQNAVEIKTSDICLNIIRMLCVYSIISEDKKLL